MLPRLVATVIAFISSPHEALTSIQEIVGTPIPTGIEDVSTRIVAPEDIRRMQGEAPESAQPLAPQEPSRG